MKAARLVCDAVYFVINISKFLRSVRVENESGAFGM